MFTIHKPNLCLLLIYLNENPFLNYHLYYVLNLNRPNFKSDHIYFRKSIFLLTIKFNCFMHSIFFSHLLVLAKSSSILFVFSEMLLFMFYLNNKFTINNLFAYEENNFLYVQKVLVFHHKNYQDLQQFLFQYVN